MDSSFSLLVIYGKILNNLKHRSFLSIPLLPLAIAAQKEITSQTDEYLVIMSSKTYVFEDNLTEY